MYSIVVVVLELAAVATFTVAAVTEEVVLIDTAAPPGINISRSSPSRANSHSSVPRFFIYKNFIASEPLLITERLSLTDTSPSPVSHVDAVQFHVSSKRFHVCPRLLIDVQ